jgi:precorrin-6B methylase 2
MRRPQEGRSTDIDQVISDSGDLMWREGWVAPLPAKVVDLGLRRGWFAWEDLIGRTAKRRWLGGWVSFDLASREIARRVISLNDKEPGTVALLYDELRPGDVFCDVGGSVGLYSIPAAQRVGESGHVVVFEPRPVGSVILEHARLNGISDRVTLIAHGADAQGEYSIDAMVGRRAIRRPTVVKIDVDGPEMAVLHGMQQLLRSEFRPRIVSVELNEPERIVDAMSNLRYRLREINLSRTGLERRRRHGRSDHTTGNGIFVPYSETVSNTAA